MIALRVSFSNVSFGHPPLRTQRVRRWWRAQQSLQRGSKNGFSLLFSSFVSDVNERM